MVCEHVYFAGRPRRGVNYPYRQRFGLALGLGHEYDASFRVGRFGPCGRHVAQGNRLSVDIKGPCRDGLGDFWNFFAEVMARH
jgi:hypothetical protein